MRAPEVRGCQNDVTGHGRWVLIEHACPLPDRQLGARPVLDRPVKDAARLVEVVAGIEQTIDLDPVAVHFSTL
jgi:hypothetical protein